MCLFTPYIKLQNGMKIPNSRFVHENDLLNDCKARGCIAVVLTVLSTPILSYDIIVICHMSSLTYDINGKICHMSAMTYDI